jgi:hypothetical protein
MNLLHPWPRGVEAAVTAKTLTGGSTGRVGSGERGGARDGAEEVGGAGCVSEKRGVRVGSISVGFFVAPS